MSVVDRGRVEMKNLVKYIFIFGLVTGSFVFGVSSGYWGGRNLNIDLYTIKETDPSKNTGVYLTYGQSNSSNSVEYGYFVKNEVFQYLLGQTFVYEDPSLGGTGTRGSVWGMVGDKLIENGVYEQVVFANSGWGGRSIGTLKNGHYFEFLVTNYNGLIKKFGRVDGILFHQGESNNSPEGVRNYHNDFSEFISNLKDRGIEIPVYLSRVSLCGNKRPINENLTNIQNQLIRDIDIVKEGPNTDLLSLKSDRLNDYCHFSLQGNDKFSDMWVELLTTNE